MQPLVDGRGEGLRDISHGWRQLTIEKAAFMNKAGNGRWGKVTGNEPRSSSGADDDHALRHPSPYPFPIHSPLIVPYIIPGKFRAR